MPHPQISCMRAITKVGNCPHVDLAASQPIQDGCCSGKRPAAKRQNPLSALHAGFSFHELHAGCRALAITGRSMSILSQFLDHSWPTHVHTFQLAGLHSWDSS